MVGWFHAPWSTACKVYESKFDEMAKTYSGYTFYKVNVDDVPHAAYDMEIEDVPQISVLPLGSKADGTSFDKTDLQVAKATEVTGYQDVVTKAKEMIDGLPLAGVPDLTEGKRQPWRFDPNTGTTLPPLDHSTA